MTETLTKNPRFAEEKWTVTSSGCWEWKGSRHAAGYGIFWDGKNVKAHRYALALATGGVMPDSHIQACHKCDNPPCVNPDHLFWGEQVDNSRDMVMKGRSPVGRPQIVPDSELQTIQDKHAAGRSMRSLGREYQVSAAAISHIVHNKRRAQSL